MTEWFAPEIGPWFSLFSLLSLLACVAPWVQQGRHKSLVTGLFIAGAGIGVALLIASLLARIGEQPLHVVMPLMLAGGLVSVLSAVMFGVVRAGYAQAEQRRILARDL